MNGGALSAGLVFLLSFGLYAALMQSQPYGDGISYLVRLRDGELTTHVPLYLPAMWSFTKALSLAGMSERTAAFLFQAFCAALANAVLYRLLASSRKLAPECTCPLRLTALIGLTPVLLFYATTVENHAHHYLWICVLLLAVDRALAAETATRWLVAGTALAACYASHSSCVLLVPALLLLVQHERGPTALRAPRRGELPGLLALLLPVVAFRVAEPWIQPDWPQGSRLDFMLSLFAARGFRVWGDYLWNELLLPAPGLWWAFLVLAARRLRGHKGDLLIGLSALVPYVVIFGHWNVREHGAYYLAFFAVLIVLLGRLMPRLRREEAVVIVLLALGQGVWGGYRARTWVDRQDGAAWTWAADAARLAGAHGTVLCWDGTRALHLRYDHGTEAQPFANWWLHWESELAVRPDLIEEIANVAPLPGLLGSWIAKPGPLLVSSDLWLELDRVEPLRPIRAKLQRDYELVDVRDGTFTGFRVKAR